MESTWSEDDVLALIRDISKYKCLWDPRDANKKNNSAKLQCYTALATKYNSTPSHIKRKWFNMLQTFRNLRRKIKSSDVYKPVWFAFDTINEFMKDIYTPREPLDSQNNDDKEDLDEDMLDMLETPEKYSTSSEKNSVHVSDAEQPSTSSRSLQRQKTSSNSRERLKRGRFEYNDDYIYSLQTRKNVEVDTINEDECKIFSKLVEVKLKKLNEHSRQIVMNDINQLFFRVFNEIASNTSDNFVATPVMAARDTFSYFTPESSSISNIKQSPSYSLSDEGENPISTDF